jgi:hypothetical protein
MNFVPVLQRSHPGCTVVMLTDRDFQLANNTFGVELFRFDIDLENLGRNAWANYYQYQGQILWLQEQIRLGMDQKRHLMFLDMDMLVVEPITEVFCQEFSYALTINANDWDPIDLGTHFIKKGHYQDALAFHKVILERYVISDPEVFTQGQVAIKLAVNLTHADPAVYEMAAATAAHQRRCRTAAVPPTAALQVDSARELTTLEVCFFSCTIYNYWEDCLQHRGQPIPQDAVTYKKLGVKVLHFMSWRKPAMDTVVEAYLEGGTDAAYSAFANLPHDEAGMAAAFPFNKGVERFEW